MKIKLAVTMVSLLLLSGCYSYKESVGVYNMPVRDIKEGTKEGKICSSENLDPFNTEIDLTVESARKRGGIKEITNIERHVSGSAFFRKVCTIVKGN